MILKFKDLRINMPLLTHNVKDLRHFISLYYSNDIRNYATAKPNFVYGQPTASTHPHLLKEDEVLPSIQKGEIIQRRTNLVNLIKNQISQSKTNISAHLIVVPSAVKKYMSDKIPYVFRQNTDYLYLTGCQEPDSCLVISSLQRSDSYTATLFVRNPDSQSEIWDGPRTNTETALHLFGVDQALPINELSNYIHSYLGSNSNHAIWYDSIDDIQPSVNNIMTKILKDMPKHCSPKTFLHKLRLKKSPAEIQLMAKSCEIASEAFIHTIGSTYPGITEHEIYARVDFTCRMQGAEYLAYPPVIAGGERATIIHYVNNNQKVYDGEMVLMDAGCEYHGYTSDVTRTWPVNGHFTDQQRELYEIIYMIQQNLIKQLHNRPPLDSLFDSMIKQLGQYLQEICLIPKTITGQNLFKEAYQFCPHHVSHYLGMDVHDTPFCPRDIKLEPNMIITLEPGIYISQRHNVPKEYQGLGIRIEDDLLITENEPEILTKHCPRDIDTIEKLAFEKF